MALAQRVKKLEARLMPLAEPIAADISPDDQDCLAVVEVSMNTLAWATPHWTEIGQTPAYKRGWELHQKLWPITPSHLDPLYGKRCSAFFDFESLHDRKPVDGDVLSYFELVENFDPEVEGRIYNQLLAEAWHRKINHLPYPLKWANELLYLRQCDHRTGAVTWAEHYSQQHPQHRWRLIEEALGTAGEVIAKSRMPITSAVMFWIDGQGCYKLKPCHEGETQ